MKKARNRLRTFSAQKSHHFSMFRSGIYLGLSVPALVVGFYQGMSLVNHTPSRPHRIISLAFRSETHRRLPIWWALLEVYATFGIPVVGALLIGLNMLAWSSKRLNYVFIFGLDLRTVIDHRVYFEVRTDASLLLSSTEFTFASAAEFPLHGFELRVHAVLHHYIRTADISYRLADGVACVAGHRYDRSLTNDAPVVPMVAPEELDSLVRSRSLPSRGMCSTFGQTARTILISIEVRRFLDG